MDCACFCSVPKSLPSVLAACRAIRARSGSAFVLVQIHGVHSDREPYRLGGFRAPGLGHAYLERGQGGGVVLDLHGLRRRSLRLLVSMMVSFGMFVPGL